MSQGACCALCLTLCRCARHQVARLLRCIVAPLASYHSLVARCVATQGRPSAMIQNLYRGSPLTARPPSCHNTPQLYRDTPPNGQAMRTRARLLPCAWAGCVAGLPLGRVTGFPPRSYRGCARPYRGRVLLVPCACYEPFVTIQSSVS